MLWEMKSKPTLRDRKLLASACLALAALVAGWSGTAYAVPITFGFTGVVSQDPLLDPDDPFGGAIVTGTPFSGSYTFESTTADGDASANGGSYTSSPGSLSVNIGGYGFIGGDLLNVGVFDGVGGDFYTVFASETDGTDTYDISLILQDLDGSVFGSALLPLSPPPLSAFELTSLFFTGSITGNQVQIDGVLTSLACLEGCGSGGGGGGGGGVPIPEPGNLWLVGIGLAGLGAVGSCRRRCGAWAVMS